MLLWGQVLHCHQEHVATQDLTPEFVATQDLTPEIRSFTYSPSPIAHRLSPIAYRPSPIFLKIHGDLPQQIGHGQLAHLRFQGQDLQRHLAAHLIEGVHLRIRP